MARDESSPFSRYLNTNYAPSYTEVTVLKCLVGDREADVVALADRIKEARRGLTTQTEEAKGALAVMEQQLAIDLQFIEEHTMLLSPIRRVPLNVLALIFQTFVEAVEQPMYPNLGPCSPLISESRPSTTISQVCSGWRRLILRTPALWTRIRVWVPPLDPDRVPLVKWCKMVEFQRLQVKTWIDRSSASPIDVGLRIGWVSSSIRSDYRAGAKEKYDALVGTLLPTSHRWQSLPFDWRVQDTTEIVLKLFDGPQFPLLRQANIYIHADDMALPAQQARVHNLSWSALFSAPALRDVTLAGFWPNISMAKASSTSPGPFYDSITHLRFEADPFGGNRQFDCVHALDMLKSLPNLVSAQINLDRFCPPLRPLSPPVHAPHLTSLELKYRPVSKGFAPSIYLPRLESLHLTSPVVVGPADGQEELLLQYGSQLRELTLYHDTLDKECLPRCLAVLVNITVLNLHAMLLGSSPDSKLDIHLLSQLSIPGILPRLEELELHDIANESDGLLENAVLEFLAQRVQCVGEGAVGRNDGVIERATILRRVRIRFAFWQGVDIAGALRTRGASLDGVDIALEYPTFAE